MCFGMNVVDGSSVVGTMNLIQYNSVSQCKDMVVLNVWKVMDLGFSALRVGW